MLKIKKLLFIALDPKRFFKGLIRYFNWLILEKVFRLISLLMFDLCPQYLYLIYGKTLFHKNERWKKRDNPEDEWIYKDNKIILNEINILCRGASLKKYSKKINKKIPTFFINYTENPLHNFPGLNLKVFRHSNFLGVVLNVDMQIDNFRNGIYPSIICRLGKQKNKKILWDVKREAYPNISYLKKINNSPYIRYLKKINNIFPERVKDVYKIYENKKLKINKKIKKITELISKKGVVHFKDYDGKCWGSALPIIFLLGSSAKKVNIYGWDQYLKKDIDKYDYRELIKTMPLQGGITVGPYGDKCKAIFSETILNFHYADRLIKQKKYKIFSRLNKIHKQKKILKNIEKVLF